MTGSHARGVLLGLVPARVLLDLLWWVELPGGFSLAQVGGAALVAVAALLAALRWRTLRDLPGGPGWLAWTAVVLVGALRAGSPLDAVSVGLQLWTPVALFAAFHAWRPADGLPAAWTVTALVPVGISLAALLAGQPAEHVLHGWPRLLGGYGNLHSHAAAMAVFAASAALLLARGERRGLHLALVLGAGTCLVATWVRGAMLLAVVAVAVGLGRRRAAVLWVSGAIGAVAALGTLRARFADLVAVLTWTPPEGGWEALGSYRVAIWTDAAGRWVGEGPVAVLLGRGLGGQYGLHRHLDPHSELLSLLFQVGVVGTVVYLGLLAWLARALLRSRARDAPVALGLLAGAATAGLVGNDVLLRPTVVAWIGAACALSVAGYRGGSGPDALRSGGS